MCDKYPFYNKTVQTMSFLVKTSYCLHYFVTNSLIEAFYTINYAHYYIYNMHQNLVCTEKSYINI